MPARHLLGDAGLMLVAATAVTDDSEAKRLWLLGVKGEDAEEAKEGGETREKAAAGEPTHATMLT
jgi:hypothetical protein